MMNANTPTPAPPLSVEHYTCRVLLSDAIQAVAAHQTDPADSALAGAADLAQECLAEAVVAAAITYRLDR